MMTETSARWAMYEMTAEQVATLIKGVKCAYARAVARLADAVHDSGMPVAEYHKDVVRYHDLQMYLTDIHAALVAPADDNAAEAKASVDEEGASDGEHSYPAR